MDGRHGVLGEKIDQVGKHKNLFHGLTYLPPHNSGTLIVPCL